jgi:hypothetical protein
MQLFLTQHHQHDHHQQQHLFLVGATPHFLGSTSSCLPHRVVYLDVSSTSTIASTSPNSAESGS